MTLGLISSKWKAHILAHIGAQPDGLRFGELSRLLPGISKRILTQSLNELDNDGFLIRTEYPQIPPKVVYTLSKLGEDIQPVILTLAEFGIKYILNYQDRVSDEFGEDKVDEFLKSIKAPEAIQK